MDRLNTKGMDRLKTSLTVNAVQLFSVSGYTYSCNDKTEKEDGCHKVEQTILGLSINAETCVCTGNLCNSASARGINFILAFSCLMIALLKYVF